MSIKVPDFMLDKLTDQLCPVHKKRLYKIDGELYCPECRSIKAERDYHNKVKENMDDSKLKDFYKDKRQKSTLEKSTGDVVKNIIKGKLL